MHPFLLLEDEGEPVPPTLRIDTFPSPIPVSKLMERGFPLP